MNKDVLTYITALVISICAASFVIWFIWFSIVRLTTTKEQYGIKQQKKKSKHLNVASTVIPDEVVGKSKTDKAALIRVSIVTDEEEFIVKESAMELPIEVNPDTEGIPASALVTLSALEEAKEGDIEELKKLRGTELLEQLKITADVFENEFTKFASSLFEEDGKITNDEADDDIRELEEDL